MKVSYLLAAVAAAALSANVSAQQLKPGLWEITHSMKSSSGEMEKSMAKAQEQMKNMPPEQRRMMEEMMAKHGVKMGAPGNTSSRMCMTKEMVERNQVPRERGDCKTTKNERRGNTIFVAFTCPNPPSSGEGQYTVVSPEQYQMKMTINTQAQGKPETMNMEGTGKWVSADCGNLTPKGK